MVRRLGASSLYPTFTPATIARAGGAASRKVDNALRKAIFSTGG
jgi:hypothetical protein